MKRDYYWKLGFENVWFKAHKELHCDYPVHYNNVQHWSK